MKSSAVAPSDKFTTVQVAQKFDYCVGEKVVEFTTVQVAQKGDSSIVDVWLVFTTVQVAQKQYQVKQKPPVDLPPYRWLRKFLFYRF